LADTPLGRTIGKNGDSEASEQILEGTFDAKHQLIEVTRFIQKCKKDSRIQVFLQEVHQTMFKSAFSGLSEKKSSSNSGRLNGYYKAALYCDISMEIRCRMMSIPFKHGIAPDRCTKVMDVMLEKNPGTQTPQTQSHTVHRSRPGPVFTNPVTRPMVYKLDQYSLIHQSQWSTWNQNCTSAILSGSQNHQQGG